MGERGSEPLPTTSLGQYAIRARIGSGGMGDVYDATHTGLNRRVAIKTLRRRFLDDETVVQRFLREGQLASRIRHPNIVDVTDVGIIGGLPCLVMEHLEGEPFGLVIKRDGPLPVTALVDLLLPIVAAVDFAHEGGVLHRDVKPSNIFLARSWNGDVTPKILDFGISKLIDESQQNGLTTDSAFVGTPHYASPELMRADRHADGRSDQYSMGVVFYEGATGLKPFTEKGGNFVALAMAICSGEFPPPRKVRPDLPASFEQVILRAMALRVEDRYPSMRALGEALLPFASERVRMIWMPTFSSAAPPTRSGPQLPATTPQEGTQVMLRPTTSSTGVPAISHFGRTGPPSGFPSVASTPGVSSTGPHPAVHPSATPPAGTYETPSYALEGGSLPGKPPAKKSAITGATMVIGFLIATLAIAGVVIAKWNRTQPIANAQQGQGQGPEVTPTATSPSALTFALSLRVSPESAAIEVDGAPAGIGKVERALPRGKHSLRVTAAGFQDITMEFDDANPPPPTLTLRALGQGQASPAVSGGPTKPVIHGQGQVGKPNVGKNPPDRPRTDNIDPWE